MVRQVRNLRSCIKVAVDFVSPDSLDYLAQLAAEKRLIALKERGAPEEKCGPAFEPARAGVPVWWLPRSV